MRAVVRHRHSAEQEHFPAARAPRQINMDNVVTHHDALEFPDGQVILLTRLCEDQRATVLQLPAAPRSAEETGQQRRVSVVV